MDQWKRKLLTDEQFRQGTVSPSFSSTLLDSIYRSIDGEEEQRGFHREAMKKKQSTSEKTRGGGGAIEKMENRERRDSMMDKWMMLEKNKENRRKSVPDFDRKVVVSNDCSSMFIHSTSSSSDSSSGGGFSSSEAESVYGSRSRSSSVPIQRPKPVRTARNEIEHHHLQQEQQKSKKQENGFIKTKSKALKIYKDLKKVKQPISPGGRLATFINSLFHAKKQGKNPANSANQEDFRSKSTQTSTCSSASSFSRSCLSKSPSTNGKSSNIGVKRTVRFYPVTVIVDEDSRPCGEKSVYSKAKNPNPNLIPSIDEKEKKQKMIQEAAIDLIANYRKNNDFNLRESLHNDEDDDEDAASYASSDLFELDNLASIGIEDRRYSEELPVYETTHFPMNRSIANGFSL